MGAKLTVRTAPRPVATEPAPGTGGGHRRDIQGLRGVAVVLVVAFHAGLPLEGGFVGVDVFFVISGFVITAMLLREVDRTATVDLLRFYRRRIRRLLPALALLLVVVALASTLLLNPFGPQQAGAKTGIAASLFGANLHLWRTPTGGYFDLASETNPLLHTWSLSVEEQFYLLFPGLLLVGSKLGRRRGIVAVVAAVTVGSFALSLATTPAAGEGGASFAFYSPLTRAWEFGVGALLALGAAALPRVPRAVAAALAVAGAAILGAGVLAIDASTRFPGSAALLPVLGTALLIAAGTRPDPGGVSRALGTRPAVRVGDISYGWYLWHWPLIVFAAGLWPGNEPVLVLVGLASLGPALLSYRLVEQPIRTNDQVWGRRVVPLAVACIAVPVVAAGGLVAVNRLEKRTGPVERYAAATALHRYGPQACDASTLDPARACTWPVDGAKGSIYLLGDSNAGQFAEPVARAGNELGYAVTVGSVGGCWFVDVVRDQACRDFVTGALDVLEAARPDLVIIANLASPAMAPDSGVRFLDPATGVEPATLDQRVETYEAGVLSVLDRLDAAGTPTLLVHTVPQLGDDGSWIASTCPALRIYAGTCGTSIGRAEVEEQQAAAEGAEARAVARVPLAAAVDLTDEICTADRCAAERDGTWLYRDATHLSVAGALTLTDELRSLISAHVRPG